MPDTGTPGQLWKLRVSCGHLTGTSPEPGGLSESGDPSTPRQPHVKADQDRPNCCRASRSAGTAHIVHTVCAQTAPSPRVPRANLELALWVRG